jgi:hypothetical protein
VTEFRFDEYVQGEATGVFSLVKAASLSGALRLVAEQDMRDDFDRQLEATIDYADATVSWQDGDIVERWLREGLDLPCPNCHSKGSYSAAVSWSDGLGMAEHTCQLCDGVGYLSAPIATLALQHKREAEKLAAELRALKVHVALYLSIIETGDTPQPPLVDAPRPASYPEVWRKYLQDATEYLPRMCHGADFYDGRECKHPVHV